MSSYITLRTFSAEELLLGEEETRQVLKFFFKAEHTFIDGLTMSDNARGFAQGLLVEAIDASYAMGYVEAMFRSAANPNQGPVKVIKAFGKKAARHWFKHASSNDLMNVKVYESVVSTIARNFRSILRTELAKTRTERPHGAMLAYQTRQSSDRVWG
ncbi:hypothetical protein DNK06_19490 [Pseudomonas daroniae]|uniref:Uncharacterized protein n=1 Tax=Phytopseudomonas daroniae TaxID=2487519 RepID=A0A4V2KAD9_9GAMM|nr:MULTISPECIES: hypothetical protein [Pseudomonas]TBU74351.1 hypothetical protein DNK06_19490 [Pseudomonas daroniae]TBU76002.1 hypothetical protein DNK10_08445 [Pseudomonas daroniae]TBU85465.1 hypothetical protein DNK31_03765 [Pseudomonas sp. FRB 228]TBU94313.1 hypothetical protein DNJ99_03765 [Pseudomonas daroniae]